MNARGELLMREVRYRLAQAVDAEASGNHERALVEEALAAIALSWALSLPIPRRVAA